MQKALVGYVGLKDDGSLLETDARKLTHINLAFGIIDDGKIILKQGGLYQRLEALRQANPELKIVLSLVGKTGADFPKVSATPQGRKKTARSCASVVADYGLDGIDLDWEYPCCPENMLDATPEDKKNFTLLVADIRNALDGLEGSHKLLTIAAGGDAYFTESTEMDQVAPMLDYVYIMTYDLRCGFHALTGHHTNLYTATGDIFRTSCDQAVNTFLLSGVPEEKILIGAAFYSRQWQDVPNRYNGFLQCTKLACTYGPAYHDLVERYINKNGYTRYWDDECKAPYLFNGSNFISYDDPESLGHKAGYVNERGLGGVFYWTHSDDNTHTLLDALHKGLSKA